MLIALTAVVLSAGTQPSEVADSLLSRVEALPIAVPGRLPLLPLPNTGMQINENKEFVLQILEEQKTLSKE